MVEEIIVDQEGRPLLNQFSEDGFVDCIFRIEELKENADRYCFHIAASFDQQVLGMNVDVLKTINSGFNEDMELISGRVYRKGVTFYRSGTDSDFLITVLAELYGHSFGPLRMLDEESFTALALHQGDVDMEKEEVKIKLFGRDADDDLDENYYESFFNLDLVNVFVYWNEKDFDFREPLIRGLSVS